MVTPATANPLYVTYVEKHGAFLKIWGQLDKNFPVIIENSLMDLTAQFEQGHFVPSFDTIQVGLFCCAKYKDGVYYRARVTNISMIQQNLVEVHFIDYGNKDILPISNLRSIVNFAPGLVTIPPQAREFILANVTHLGLSWDANTIMLVSNEIRYMDLHFIVVQQVNTYTTLIKLYKNSEDYALSLFNRGLVLSMASVSQNMILQSTSSATPAQCIQPTLASQPTTPTVRVSPPGSASTPALLSYKAVTIEPGSENNVYVSYVSDGPCQFSVQLQKLEENLARLMRELNRMTLQPLEEDPLPGTVCVAKCLEDDHICRAVVTSMVDGQYKVFYVDFGNSEVVPLTHLYQIPFKYVILKVMAMRYALAGLERSSVTLEMKCAFKEFVSDKLLRMQSLPAPTRSGLPLCSLWDSNNVNVLDVLKKAALLAYPENTPLTRGFSQEVLVSYVYSCSHFYVQLKSKEEDLRKVMADLQSNCPMAEKVQLSELKIGLPCCALFETDSQWYRAQVLSNEDDIVKVRYVDYGNEELVNIINLRMPIGNLLTALRPQAVECCLNGYQNMEDDVERDNILEELILEKEFTMRVIEMQNSRALVDLIDSARYNVGSLLLEKLASARSQVSPLLIQESYQIEQRKRQSPNKFERNNSRDSDKSWSRQDSNKVLSPRESIDKPSYQKDSNRGFSRKDLNNRFNQDFKDRTTTRPTSNHTQSDEWNDGNQESSPPSNDWRSNKKQESWRQDRAPRRDRGTDGGGAWNNDKPTRKDREGESGGTWNNDRFPRKDRDGDSSSWNNDKPNRRDRSGDMNNERPPRKDRDTGGGGWNSERPPRKDRDGDSGGWNNDKSPRKDDGDGWNNDKSKKDGFKDRWGGGNNRDFNKNKREHGSWGDKEFGQGDGRNYNENRKNVNKSSWGDNPPTWKQKEKSPSQKEGSDKGWEGSDTNWRRNNDSRAFKRNDFKDKPFFKSNKPTWNNETNLKKVEDPADDTTVYTYVDYTGKCEEVIISWFHNPANFYCQLKQSETEFRSLMEDIQNWYCKIGSESLPVGAPVIALFPEDSVLYRGYISEMKGTQYYVHFVDFGNFSLTDKVWRIEKKFMTLPAQALFCSLNGLIPIEENGVWPSIESFSLYFEKESFQCTFISNENNCYFVDLASDNITVSESLLSAGLAKYVEYGETENYDPSILCGQQIHVTLSELESLDSFTIILQNAIPLLCTVHNLENATETFEDTLKQYVGLIVIMYVDNVLEDKTQITLYDTTGMKIKTIEPDEGAYESIEPLCPLPVLSSTINGWVSFVNADEKKAFIQPSEYADNVAQLLDGLYNHYDTTTLEEPLQPEVGRYYAAHSADGNWYRGLALSVEDQNTTLCYIDYGNSETIANIELRELTQEFKEQHLLALEVTSSDIDGSFVEQEIIVTVWYGESGWEAQIQAPPEITAVPVEETISSNAEPAKTIEAESVKVEHLVEVKQPVEELTTVGVPVCLSHIDSPNEFYVQLQEAVETIDNLQATLQEDVESYAELENPAAGVLCAAQYSVDQLWYRARVLDADSEITTVRFVDYGNTDVITTNVKTLPPEMLALEQYARRCSLLIKSLIEEEWSAATFERFEVLTQCEVLSVEIIHQDEKTTYVDLYADNQSIAEVLLQEGLATKLDLEIESSCTGYVSNLNSPSEFWVQLENSVADLEWVAEQLSSADKFTELEDLTPGSLCAALYPDDEMWYRARILSNTVAGIEVLFIDYGNSCTCTGLRQLPEDLIMLPALAQKCSLLKPAGVLQWSSQATEQFKSISADGATVFNIEKFSTGETLIVKLLLNSEDISINLLPQTEAAYITHLESINCFWLQKSSVETQCGEITDMLVNASEFPVCDNIVVDDIVAALYTNDELWYRARILSIKENEYEVLFIDYGNLSCVSEVRSLSEEDKYPPLASKHKMEPIPGFRWIDEEATQKLGEISNEGTTVFEAEFAGEDIVRLYLNGSDIRSGMDAASISSIQSSPKKTINASNSEATKIRNALEMNDDNLYINNENDMQLLPENNTDSNVFICENKEDKSEYLENNEETDEQYQTTLDVANEEEVKSSSKEIISSSNSEVTKTTNQEMNDDNVYANNENGVQILPENNTDCNVLISENINNKGEGGAFLKDTEESDDQYQSTENVNEEEVEANEDESNQEINDDNLYANNENGVQISPEDTDCNVLISENINNKEERGGFLKDDEEPDDQYQSTENVNEEKVKENENELENNVDDQETTEQIDHHTLTRRSSTPHCEKIVPGSICRGDLTEVDAETETNGAGSPKSRSSTPECDKSGLISNSPQEEPVIEGDLTYDIKIEDSSGGNIEVLSDKFEQKECNTVTTMERRPSTPHCDRIVPGVCSRGEIEENKSTNELLVEEVNESEECNKTNKLLKEKSVTVSGKEPCGLKDESNIDITVDSKNNDKDC